MSSRPVCLARPWGGGGRKQACDQIGTVKAPGKKGDALQSLESGVFRATQQPVLFPASTFPHLQKALPVPTAWNLQSTALRVIQVSRRMPVMLDPVSRPSQLLPTVAVPVQCRLVLGTTGPLCRKLCLCRWSLRAAGLWSSLVPTALSASSLCHASQDKIPSRPTGLSGPTVPEK